MYPLHSFKKTSHFSGTYQGQWLRGLRHGYGVRTSAPFGMASHNKLSETRMASMTSLNKEEEAAQAHQEAMEEAEATATAPAAAAAVAAARTISRRGEEARGGFVLRAKSDEYPSRRRSLVERTGMKTLVQVKMRMSNFISVNAKFGLRHKLLPPFFAWCNFWTSWFFRVWNWRNNVVLGIWIEKESRVLDQREAQRHGWARSQASPLEPPWCPKDPIKASFVK